MPVLCLTLGPLWIISMHEILAFWARRRDHHSPPLTSALRSVILKALSGMPPFTGRKGSISFTPYFCLGYSSPPHPYTHTNFTFIYNITSVQRGTEREWERMWTENFKSAWSIHLKWKLCLHVPSKRHFQIQPPWFRHGLTTPVPYEVLTKEWKMEINKAIRIYTH